MIRVLGGGFVTYWAMMGNNSALLWVLAGLALCIAGLLAMPRHHTITHKYRRRF